MTELEYVIATFAERFAPFLGKRIILHGSRNYAEAIIKNYANEFQFVGIMSMDPLEGNYFHGLKIIRVEDLSALDVDLIILTERVKYAEKAFHSIRLICKNNHIAIYNMYGIDEFHVHNEAENNVILTLERAKSLCEPYDIIAFEVVDTLTRCSYENLTLHLRKVFYDLISFLRRKRKEIRFSIRKSFSTETQKNILIKYNLVVDEAKELVYRYGEDLSFRTLQESSPGKKILYFGSGIANEFILPRCYGIDTYRFVDVYNIDCLVPGKRKVNRSYSFSANVKMNIENRILEKEWVSFDIFDTLLVRKTLFPRDVFFMTEKKALSDGYHAEGFVNARIRAEEALHFGDINQIYSWMQDFLGWSNETALAIQTIELDIEREVLTPRTEIIELFNFALHAGKHVVLISDMYIPETILSRFLSENGISGYERLMVSCDVKKSKHTGLFGEIIKLCDRTDKILHIGDNPVSDGADCEAAGIESILIPSALEMARNRGWGNCIYTASNLLERSLLGLVIYKIFRNPFQNPNLTEWTTEKQIERFGISVVAPLVIGHMTWLIQKLQEDSFNGVLFFARDGWISYIIYQQIQKEINLPPAVYYYANRKASFLCCADSKQEIEKIVGDARLSGLNATEILTKVFQMPMQDLLPYEENDTVSDYIEKHTDRIQKQADKAKNGYLLFSEKCGIKTGGHYAVVDGFASGYTQKCMSQWMPFYMKGFYFGIYSTDPLIDGTEYYLQNNESLLLRRFIELETFLVSLEPSQKCMSEQGCPVFEEEYRSRQELREVKMIIDLAESIAKDFFAVFYQKGHVISSQLIEEMYAAEDYYAAQHALYDDRFGSLIRKREDVEKETNDV